MNRARIVILLLLAGTLVTVARPAATQERQSVFDDIRREHEWIEKHLHEPMPVAAPTKTLVRAQAATAAPQPIDVQHYRLQIRFSPDPLAISGTVTVEARTTAQTSTVTLDALDNLTIDAVRVDNATPF